MVCKVKITLTQRIFYRKILFFWFKYRQQLKLDEVWYDEYKDCYVACDNCNNILYKKGKS
jgi:hypothetical protein